MVAPSPDWFVGVSGLDLIESGNWVADKTVTLLPWDAGTDDGASYESADLDAQPRQPVRQLSGAPVATGGGWRRSEASDSADCSRGLGRPGAQLSYTRQHPLMTSLGVPGGRALCAAALALCALAQARAAASPPLSFAGGRLRFAGQLTGNYGSDDEGYFNYGDYETSRLRLFRVDLGAELRFAEQASLLADVRSDNLGSPRVYALYLRLRPWAAHVLDLQAGLVPPVFGALPRRSYGVDEPLPSLPLVYQYLTDLRHDAVPASAEELVSQRARGWLVHYPSSPAGPDPGLPLAAGERWDAGLQLRLGAQPAVRRARRHPGLTEPPAGAGRQRRQAALGPRAVDARPRRGRSAPRPPAPSSFARGDRRPAARRGRAQPPAVARPRRGLVLRLLDRARRGRARALLDPGRRGDAPRSTPSRAGRLPRGCATSCAPGCSPPAASSGSRSRRSTRHSAASPGTRL